MAKPKKRKKIDWEAIEGEYRTGQLSNVEIAKQHGISEGYIRKRAAQYGWKKDLAAKVRKAVKERLVRDEVREPNATDEEIEDAAVERGVELLKSHRKDIKALREAEAKLIKEIFGDPKKTWVGQFQGKVITKTFSITATERSSALQALAGVQHKRIALERQAFGIDEDGRRPDEARDIEVTFVSPDGNPYTREDPE
jgi:hypothetical protein